MPLMRPWLQLVRAGTLFSPAADVLAGKCIVAASAASSLWDADLGRLMAASVLVYAGGMACNDAADVEQDRKERPDRPIPRGAIRRSAALSLGLGLLACGVAVSPAPLHHGLLAALVLLYDFMLKRWTLTGAGCMATLRALNLGTAAVLGGGSWTSATITACLCYGVYILAVTILGAFEDDRTVRARAVTAIHLAPMWSAIGGLVAVQDGLWPAPALALAPVLLLARRNREVKEWTQQQIRTSMGYLLLGTMLYTGLLALAAGRPLESAGILSCIPIARMVTARLRFATIS